MVKSSLEGKNRNLSKGKLTEDQRGIRQGFQGNRGQKKKKKKKRTKRKFCLGGAYKQEEKSLYGRNGRARHCHPKVWKALNRGECERSGVKRRAGKGQTPLKREMWSRSVERRGINNWGKKFCAAKKESPTKYRLNHTPRVLKKKVLKGENPGGEKKIPCPSKRVAADDGKKMCRRPHRLTRKKYYLREKRRIHRGRRTAGAAGDPV